MPAVVFDKANRELRTVRFHFADKGEAVVKISWEPGIRRRVEIVSGQLLARIEWRRSGVAEVLAPKACNGTIQRTNRRVAYDKLRRESVLLLALEKRGVS